MHSLASSFARTAFNRLRGWQGARKGVLPKYDELSLTPRFSGVETSHLYAGNRFNGLATGKTVETVASLPRSPVTPLKQGVNETARTIGQRIRKSNPAICEKAGVVAILLLSVSSQLGLAQPKSELAPPPPLSPAEGEREARTLLSNLLSQKPDQNATNTGVLKIRDAQRHERAVPVKFEVFLRPNRWLNSYEATPAEKVPGERLTITHEDGRSNSYAFSPIGATNLAESAPKTLAGNQLMTPFAGSDFWAVDLGLEFLYWPEQRVLKKQMRKNLFCDVLQSTNPCSAPGAYSRVLSWIAVNRPDDIVVVHAEAYDSEGKLLKEFDPKKVQKVNGVWQLEEMEIRNRQTGSRTRIEFNLEQ